MLVEYKKELGVRVVPLSDIPGQPEGTTVSGKQILLTPGWNEITVEDWPHVEANMEADYQNGDYKYQCKTITNADGKEVREQLSIGEVRADLAKNIIRGCYNIYTLKRWTDDVKLTAELRNTAEIQLKKCEEFDGKD